MLTATRSLLALDAFVVSIFVAMGLGLLLPPPAGAARPLELAVTIGIGLLFFGYGARLATGEVVRGATSWRLQLAVVVFTFGFFPVLGVVLYSVLGPWLGSGLAAGFLYLCLVPSTMQAAVSFTSIAGGDVAASVVASTLSNVVGVFVTPVLALALLPAARADGLSLAPLIPIVVGLVLPFLAGQLVRPVLRDVVDAHAKKLATYDKVVVVVVVYAAFGQGRRFMTELSAMQTTAVIAISLALLVTVFAAALAAGRGLGFTRGERIALLFCGSKKSLISGMPIAAALFPAGVLGVVVFPLVVFHQIQLVVAAQLARRMQLQGG